MGRIMITVIVVAVLFSAAAATLTVVAYPWDHGIALGSLWASVVAVALWSGLAVLEQEHER